MSSLKKSLGMSFAAQYAEVMIQFVGALILARIISPEDVGVYSVAAFVMAILHVFRDFGVGKYLIREEELTPQKIRSTLGVAIILAWGVAIIMFLARDVVADFYNHAEISAIMTVMAGSFAISPLGSIFTSLFRRDMQFNKILIVRIASALGHVCTATTLALLGYGALSLAWANFAGILLFGIASFSLRSPGTPWTPSFRHMREILSFGGTASIGSLAYVAGSNSSDIVIGKMISLSAAGWFSRANGLIAMFRTFIYGVVNPLILPFFSQLKRNEGDVHAPYRSAIEHLTVLAWPFYAVMAILAFPVVRTLYGDQWDASIPVARLLALGGAISSLTLFASDLMIAWGHVQQMAKMQAIIQGVRVLLMVAACPFGLSAVGAALVLAELLILVISSRALHAAVGIRLAEVLAATRRSALVTAASCIGPLAVVLSMPDTHPMLMLAIGGAAAACGWLGAIFWFDHPVKAHVEQARGWVRARYAK